MAHYKTIVDEMTWSYSRLECYEECPKKWFMRYIQKKPEEKNFYAEFGSFVHSILEKYYSGLLTEEGLSSYYYSNVFDTTEGVRLPKQSIVNKRILEGGKYFSAFKPYEGEVLGVEEKVEFEIDGSKFVGIIDLLLEKDGELYIIDNKSRNLEQRKGKPASKNEREIDKMLRQLYLYSEGVKQNFGRYPNFLCFNCFRNGNTIIEPFNEEVLQEVKQWALGIIDAASFDEEFEDNYEFFKCVNLCGVSDFCDKKKEERDIYFNEKSFYYV